MIHEITKRLAYVIYERRRDAGYDDFDDNVKNYFQASDMIQRIIDGHDDIESLKAYLNSDDYEVIDAAKRLKKACGRKR